jgi:hypothetical protein
VNACVARIEKGLSAALSDAQAGGRYVADSNATLAAVESAFVETLRASSATERLIARWRSLGFEVDFLGDGCRNPVWVITEAKGAKRGRGFYAVRKGPRTWSQGIQAPHSRDDLHTGAIAASLFSEFPFSVGAWNTVDREQVDLSHTYVSVYQAFMRASSRHAARGGFAQLHGFDVSRRATAEAARADVILGDGAARPAPRVVAAAATLSELLKARAKVYARDVRELGGTTNDQARLLRTLDAGPFLHVEMSLTTRERLLTDAPRRAAFARALLKGLEPDPTKR